MLLGNFFCFFIEKAAVVVVESEFTKNGLANALGSFPQVRVLHLEAIHFSPQSYEAQYGLSLHLVLEFSHDILIFSGVQGMISRVVAGIEFIRGIKIAKRRDRQEIDQRVGIRVKEAETGLLFMT
jgi:hypothetical protein